MDTMEHRRLSNLRQTVDDVTTAIGDTAMYGDVWRAALLTSDLEPAWWQRLLVKGLGKGVEMELRHLHQLHDRVRADVAALGRLIDHVEATNPKAQRRGRQLAPVARLAAPQTS